MKKLIATLVIVGGLVGLGFWASTKKFEFSILTGRTAQVTRGDVTRPIKATGVIEPARTVEIKSKASGEVEAVYFQPGDMVEAGTLLVKLNPIDEDRNVGIATVQRDQADANKRKAEITLEERTKTWPITKDKALAQLARAEAQLTKAEVDYKRRKKLQATDSASLLELLTFESLYKEAKATRDQAQADLDNAEIGNLQIELAQQDVKLMQSALERAEATLREAEERLKETKVLAPVTGMVTRSRGREFIEKGEVIQSGKASLTGGTVLMKIADIGQLYVIAKVDEADIGDVLNLSPAEARPGGKPIDAAEAGEKGAGQLVRITVDAFKDDVFEGKIERILPEATGIGAVVTYDVRIKITSENRVKLRGVLGLQAEVEFTAKSVQDALLVPYDAVKRDHNGLYGVYVAVKSESGTGTKAVFRSCRFGINDGIKVQVLEGLDEGETVYVRLPQKTRKQREAEERAKGDE